MLCHKTNNQSPAERKQNVLLCQGWLRVMGRESIGVRIALSRGLVSFEEMEDTKGPQLFKTFEEMLTANDIPIPPRNQLIPIRALSDRMRKR